ncbi:MAG: response regulator [Bacteroidales bacterium]|nr:response regulator [Bacteroidales bacterium]
MEIRKISKSVLNLFNLSFTDKKTELDYLIYYRKNTIKHIRVVMLISLIIFGLFAWLDYFLFPELSAQFIQIRFYFVLPFVIFVIFYTFLAPKLMRLQLITALGVLVGGYSIIYMIYLGGPEVNLLYYAGITLVFFFNYDFLKLRFQTASLIGALLLAGYFLVAYKINVSTEVLVSSMFFLVSANIMGMVSAYFYEKLNRQFYYSQLIVAEEQQKTTENNLRLEEEVQKRTANLAKTNTELIIAKEAAEESERLKSVFLATMSHELRTPLNAIIGFSEFIISDEFDSSENEMHAQIINKSGLDLLNMVENLLDITLIDSGQIILKKNDFLLVEFLADINYIIRQERVNLEKEAIKISFDAINISSDFYVHTDKNKLKQILINLLKNALKFTEQGEIKFWCEEITIGAKQMLKFWVSDTGIGIPKSKQKFIFDVFRQADDSKARKHEGIGIGLSVVKKLVDLFGGEVGMDAEEGKGSVFYFTIDNYKSEIKSSEPQKNDLLESMLGRYNKILVVEDDSPSYNLLEILINRWGFEVAWAKNGKMALDMMAENQNFDLILMDLKMPVLNGFEATKQIKSLYPNCIIIAQTAYAIAPDREKALLAGCDGFIAKPISAEKLKAVIEQFVPISDRIKH